MPLPRFRLRTLMIAVAVVKQAAIPRRAMGALSWGLALSPYLGRIQGLDTMEGAMRLPKMTTRRWMVAVIISAGLLAVSLEVDRELRLASQYRVKAELHARQAELTIISEGVNAPAGFVSFAIPSPELAAYHESMRRKYEVAAARPWKPVEPDPPSPK